MIDSTRLLVYPDGATQETQIPLPINQIVDLNGRPLRLPLPTHREIVYRVQKIRKIENRGEEITNYYLELVGGIELLSLCE